MGDWREALIIISGLHILHTSNVMEFLPGTAKRGLHDVDRLYYRITLSCNLFLKFCFRLGSQSSDNYHNYLYLALIFHSAIFAVKLPRK
jgi:hypothetical protein